MWCFATDVPLLLQSIPKRHLLVLVHFFIRIFDKETLLKSSLRGGKSRTSQDDNQKCPLNEAKVASILGQFILRIVYLNECIVHNMFKLIKHL